MTTAGGEKIHLVHLTTAPGGLEVILPMIVKSLPAFEFRAFIIRPETGKRPDVYEGTGIVRKYGSGNNLVAAARLFLYARRYRNEIFHVYNSGPIFLLVLRMASVRKVVYSIHGTIYWKNNAQKLLMKVIWQLALSERFKLTANSAYSRKVFLESVMEPPQEIGIIYNPVGAGPSTGSSGPREEGLQGAGNTGSLGSGRESGLLTIGYAGRLVPGKNLFLWLSVAHKLSSDFRNIRFMVYGDGILKDDLMRRAGDLGISGLISFRGFSRDIASAYRECDMMLFLSERESFGNVVVESVLCGTPVIASDIPAFREILANWSYCLVPADDTAATHVAGKLRNLNLLRQNLPGMSSEFRERFSPEQHIFKISKIYETLSS